MKELGRILPGFFHPLHRESPAHKPYDNGPDYEKRGAPESKCPNIERRSPRGTWADRFEMERILKLGEEFGLPEE